MTDEVLNSAEGRAFHPPQQNPQNRPINCDQVSWLMDIAERHIARSDFPGISQQREMQKYAMLYEIMDVAGLRFEDDRARWNGTPNQARDYGDEDV